MSYASLDRNAAKIIAGGEQRLAQAYASSLSDVRASLREMYDKHAVGGKLTLADASKYRRWQNLEKDLVAASNKINRKSQRIISKTITDSFAENFYHTGFTLEAQQVGAALRFGMLNESQIAAALDNPLDKIKWSDRLKDKSTLLTNQLRSEIAQGLIQGKGYADMSRLVKERMEIGANKTLRIMRTEAHRAQNEGRLNAMEKAEPSLDEIGLVPQRVWNSALDSVTRPTHRVVDGQIAKNGDGSEPMFTVGGVKARGPGLTGIAKEDIRCRCSVRMQFEGYEPEARRIRGEGIVKNETYTEWAERKGIDTPKIPDVPAKVPTAKAKPKSRDVPKPTVKAKGSFDDFNIKNTKQVGDVAATKQALKRIEADAKKAMDRYPKLAEFAKKNPLSELRIEGSTVMTTKGFRGGGKAHVNGLYHAKQKKIQMASGKRLKNESKLRFGGFSVDDSIEGTFRHEYGHHVFNTIPYKDTQTWRKAFYPPGYPSNISKEAFDTYIVKTRRKLSEYGVTDAEEGFCESFAAYTHPAYARGGLPRSMEKYLDGLFR